MKPCPKCGVPVRTLGLTRFGRRYSYEHAGEVFVLAGNGSTLKRVKSWLSHRCDERLPDDPIGRAAAIAVDPVARAAFAAIAEAKKQ